MKSIYDYKRLGHSFKKKKSFKVSAFQIREHYKHQPITVSPKTLLIVRFDHTGDYILFRNFLSDVRSSSRFGDHHITLAGNAAFKELAEHLDHEIIDEFFWINRQRFQEDKFYNFQMLKGLNARGFSTVIHPTFSRDFYSDMLVNATQAPERIGSQGDLTNISKERKKTTDLFYTQLLPASPKLFFEFDRNREFFKSLLGVTSDSKCPMIETRNLASPNLPFNNYCVLFPGASTRRKRWPATYFIEISNYLNQKYKLASVLCGQGSDREAIDQIYPHLGHDNVINLLNKTSIVTLAGVLKNASLLVSNDTLAVHLMAALGGSVVCVTAGNHLARFNRYPEPCSKRVRFVFPPHIDLLSDRERLSHTSRYRDNDTLEGITAERIVQEIDRVLS